MHFTGVRLYFTTSPFNTPFSGPSMLTLVHVRLPPGFSARSSNPPSAVHTAFHREGTLLLVASQNDDNDILWAVSSDSFPFQKQLMETQVCSWNEKHSKNCFKSNFGETCERQGGAHMGFSKCMGTILN